MSDIAAADVWAALMRDPDFTKKIPSAAVREALRPFVEKSPEILSAHLDYKLTLRALVDSKVAFLNYCLANGYADALAPITGLPADTVAGLLWDVVDMLTNIRDDMPRLLKAAGITEEELMLHPRVGLNDSTAALYRAGTLTVGQVLLTQPSVILEK